MSYDVYMVDPDTGDIAELDEAHGLNGGTYCAGSTRAEFNITYNYAGHIYRALGDDKGVRSLYGRTGADTAPALRSAVEALEEDEHPDYWEPTEGNARKALQALLWFAEKCPDAVWKGD